MHVFYSLTCIGYKSMVLLIIIVRYIYIYIYILLTLPGRACSAFLDTFHPSFSIVHRGWYLIYITSGILQ